MTEPLLATTVPPDLIAEIEASVPRCQWVALQACVFPARHLITYTCPTCRQDGCVYVCLLHKGLLMLGRGSLSCGACDHVVRGTPLKADKL